MSVQKTSFWLAFSFYFVIAFEFFYMISPFAVYFYSVYQPGLEFINQSPALAWLSSIFLPHIVNETRSTFLNHLTTIGFILTFGGGLFFCYGAIQIYWSKLTKKTAVKGGLYGFVRHPQYSALIICGLGMLLLWPRFIVLISYISMLFVYFFLARFEEKECLEKYGDSYQHYLEKTPIFFPFLKKLPPLPDLFPNIKYRRLIIIPCIYLMAITGSIIIASWVRSWSLTQLYAHYEKNDATISIIALPSKTIETILTLTRNDPKIRRRLQKLPSDTKLINYIVPIDWSASEIPMHPVNAVDHFDYRIPSNQPQHKVVITRSAATTKKEISGKQILLHSKDRLPILEAIVDTSQQIVEQVIEPVEVDPLASVPLPVF